MSSRIYQATIIILDVGKDVANSSEEGEKEVCFFQKARECTGRIIEGKIISQGKHLLGIILLGAKNTNNPLAEQAVGSFLHIDMFATLQTPTWNMIRNLPETASESNGDWFDALIVAAHHFKSGEKSNIANKRIILITNFKAPSYLRTNREIEEALKDFKKKNYEVGVLGIDVYNDDNNCPDINLARQFVHETKGASATFDHIRRCLFFHRTKLNSNAWNIDLSIGPNIKIPVSTYIRIKNEPTIKNWMKAVKDPVENTARTTEAIINKDNKENRPAFNLSFDVKRYQYGQQYIPLTECDKKMLYQPGPKSLSVYGFTSIENISWQNFSGDGLYYVFGRKGDIMAQKAITCLALCLSELNLIGVVRRVYSNGSPAKMFALMPVIDNNNFICLSLIELCYKEDIKNMSFPATNLKKYDCTTEQVNAFKDLIKAMDLTKAYGESEYDVTEAFPVAETVSPSDQYILDCIAFRAMNPHKPLPEPRELVKALLRKPPLIQKLSKEPLQNIKKLFSLNKVLNKQ